MPEKMFPKPEKTRIAPRKGVFRLRVKCEFSAAHALRNYQGPCEKLHGHNFTVEVEVKGERLSHDTEILMDFKQLKSLLNSVLVQFDHQNLNEVSYFRRRNPSSENLARYIYWELGKLLGDSPVSLESVSVGEKDSSLATYCEETC